LCGYFENLSKGKDGEKFAKIVEVFAKEAKVGGGEKKYKDMLEKKWRSILRLEKRIDELVESNREIQDNMKNFGNEGKVVESEVLPGEKARHVINGHRGPITAMCFHPRFNILVTASEDNTVKVWDADSGGYERTLTGHTDTVNACQFNKDGSILATTSTDTTVRLWDFGKENDGTFACTKTLLGHDHTVSFATFSKDGEFLFSCSRDKTIKMWELESGHCKMTFEGKGTEGHSDWVRVVRQSPDETRLASCGLDHAICIWDIKTGNCLDTLRDHDHVVEDICWSNKKADTGIISYILDEDDKKAAQVNVKSAAEQGKPAVGGMFVLSCSRDKTMRIWMIFEGVCVKTIRGHDSWVRGVLFHPSGRYMLSCSDDKTVRVWDIQKYGRCKSKMEVHESFVSCLAWNNHSPMMATGSVDNSVKIWECS